MKVKAARRTMSAFGATRGSALAVAGCSAELAPQPGSTLQPVASALAASGHVKGVVGGSEPISKVFDKGNGFRARSSVVHDGQFGLQAQFLQTFMEMLSQAAVPLAPFLQAGWVSPCCQQRFA